MKEGSKILCVGQIVADVVVRPVDKLPVPGRLDQLGQMELVPGGCACNTAGVLAKLGAPTRIAGLVGRDAFGEAILAMVRETGVDVGFVSHTSETPTTAVVVAVASDGQRSFLYRPGTNERFTNSMVPVEALREARIVHVGGAMKLLELDMAELFRQARAAGCVTSLDTDWSATGRWMEMIGPAIPHLDYLITNEEEGERVAGVQGAENITEVLRDLGARTVIVKMGAKGSAVCSEAGFFAAPPFEVDVVDTTCAGDAFVAGFLFGVANGSPLEDSMVLGNAAGALATTRLSHYGVTSLEDTLGFIRAHRDGRPGFELR